MAKMNGAEMSRNTTAYHAKAEFMKTIISVRIAVKDLIQRTMLCEVATMITGILVAIAITFGAILLHATFMYGEIKGYEHGLDDAEQIAREVLNENNDKADATRNV